MEKAFNFTKSANISGAVMKIHPHGDSYGSAVSMVQPDRNLVPLLVGKGNFGNYTSRELQPAASRYSEIKLSEIAIEMMKDFKKNIVNFIPNYDGTIQMPEVLPVKFPAILAYAQSGIGVGFSSSTASYNLNEICDSVIKYLQTGEHDILVPDFATGGMIIKDEEVFKQLNKEGNGTVRLRGKAEIVGNEILITEVPYTTTREAIIDKVVELARSGRLKEVTDIKDLTGLKGMMIEVTARRGTNMDELLEKLYRFTPLQSTHSSNMNILINDLPKVMGVHSIIEEWVAWRRDSLKRAFSYDVEQMKKELHILRGLEKVLLDIDSAIDIIRKTKSKDIEKVLMKTFNIDFTQAENVANMKLRNINEEYILKQIRDINALEEKIKDYEETVSNDSKLNDVIISDLTEIKEKFGCERRTKIIELGQVIPIRLITTEAADYEVKIHLTKEGYVYKFKNDSQPHLKPGDEVIRSFNTFNSSQVLVFTDDVLCYKIDTKRIEETKINSLGSYIPSLVREDSLNIINYSILDKNSKMILAVYENNRIAKIDMKVFGGNRRILKNAYHPKQGLIDLITLSDEAVFKLKTDKTEVTVTTEELSLASSRLATGVYVTRKGKAQKIELVK